MKRYLTLLTVQLLINTVLWLGGVKRLDVKFIYDKLIGYFPSICIYGSGKIFFSFKVQTDIYQLNNLMVTFAHYFYGVNGPNTPPNLSFKSSQAEVQAAFTKPTFV